jgi:hypothetical protein
MKYDAERKPQQHLLINEDEDINVSLTNRFLTLLSYNWSPHQVRNYKLFLLDLKKITSAHINISISMAKDHLIRIVPQKLYMISQSKKEIFLSEKG